MARVAKRLQVGVVPHRTSTLDWYDVVDHVSRADPRGGRFRTVPAKRFVREVGGSYALPTRRVIFALDGGLGRVEARRARRLLEPTDGWFVDVTEPGSR